MFYQDLLGFDKICDFIVSSGLSHQLFGISQKIKVLVFEKETVIIEVFLSPEFSIAVPNWKSDSVYPGYLLKDQYIGLEEVDNEIWDVYLGTFLLGRPYDEKMKIVFNRKNIKKV